jgi:Mlc titration factor MtfA (ptsG expression regulator)
MVVWSFKEWRRRRVTAGRELPQEAWHALASGLPLLRGLDEEERSRLHDLALLFLDEKQFVAAGDLELVPDMALLVAVEACLPILNLGFSCYDGWVSVILYPGEFMPEHEYMDEAGVVHTVRDIRIGESWERGPMVLSWSDVSLSGEEDGVNVVIHECAHKLDMLNGGEANGFPPMHDGMTAEEWSRVFSDGYGRFCRRVDSGEETALDPYAAESPGEFFAVTSEAFFETPQVLARDFPAVYRQLAKFYRQDPLVRFERGR